MHRLLFVEFFLMSLLILTSGTVASSGEHNLAGSSWHVVAYNNGRQAVVSVLDGTHITVHFGEDGRITGSAGCNQYFATYETADASMTIGQPGSTRRFCAEPEGIMEQDAGFLEALRSVATFRLDADRLDLRTADGAMAMSLVRAAAALSAAGSAFNSKIRFDLDRLDADGLQGPPDGLRALHYEYCIPDQADAMHKVIAIDPRLQIQRNSPGRIGCDEGELLCLGDTHQPNYRTVLQRLAALSIVREIRKTHFE